MDSSKDGTSAFDLVITPSGHLRIEDGAYTDAPLAEPVARALRKAFAESGAAGLLLLATDIGHELPAALVYWRGFARKFFQRLCHLEEGISWDALPEPDNEELERLVAEAPPMRGLEYLTPAALSGLWRELHTLVVARGAAHPGGPAAWLRTVNPLWHLVGRVTFHLAENKRDPERPFAFLATFTHRLSSQARPQHLPLAEALRTYVGAKEQAKLTALLEPVRRAAQGCPLVRELLESKALFTPQAWTIREAYRFLTEAPRIEEAGVVVRLPDWWSATKPPRPQVQVHIGGKPISMIGMDQMLDFHADLALDGEPLTDDERRQLLAATDGLVLLRGKWVEADRERLDEALKQWKALQKEHAEGISFIEGMRLLAGAKLESADGADGALADWSRITAGDWLKQTLERLRHPESIDACQPGRDLQATLRPYQVDGVRWLWFMTELGLGGCLADDMGLGKTVQLIDLLLLRKRHAAQQGTPAKQPSLLIVPASLIGNWRQELAKFAPSLRVFYAHRSETPSEELDRVAKKPDAALADHDLVITTYGLARRQVWLEKRRWSLIVLDEAQAIKNAGSTQTRTVKKLQGRLPARAHRHPGRKPPGRSVVPLRLLFAGPARLRGPVQAVRQAAQ